MHLLLLSMSAHLTKQLGMAPGGEFRRAYHEVNRPYGMSCMTCCNIQFPQFQRIPDTPDMVCCKCEVS